MKKYIFNFLICAILFPLGCSAQYVFQGNVRGASSAEIYIHSIDKKVNTDSSGYFRIKSIPSGTYTIELSSALHQPILISVTFPCKTPKQTPIYTLQPTPEGVSLSADLTVANYPIQDVVISSSRISLQQHLPQPIEVASVSDMYERGQLSIMETMSAKPGVSLITTGPGIARPVIRGLSGNRIVTVLNGVKLENQQWDLEHTLGMNQYGIDRVEIIKGPSTFLYGSDAMGGVLDFIDEKPAPVNHLIGNLSGGFNSNTFGSNSYVGIRSANERVRWSLHAGLNNSSDYYDANFKRVANSRYREFLGKASVGLTHKKSVTLLSYQVNMGYYGIVEPFESDSGKTEEEDHPMEFENPYHTLLHQTAIAKNTLHLGNTKLISTLSFQNDQRKELEPGNTEENPYLGLQLNIGTINLKAEHSFSDNVSLIVGTEGSLQHNSNNGYGRLIPDYRQNEMAIFGISRAILWKNRLSVDAGIRYDYRSINSSQNGMKDSVDYMSALSRHFANTSASLGINLTLTKSLSLYTNIGTGYRAPNLAELTSNGIRLETQRYEIGNALFTKETNRQVDVGLVITGKQLNMEVSGFYNHINNYIYVYRRGDSISQKPVYTFGQNDALIYGMEYKLRLYPKAAKWINVNSSFSMLHGVQSGGEYLPLMPPYKLTMEVTFIRESFYFSKNVFLRLGSTTNWAQNRTAGTEMATPGYTLVNIGAGGEIAVRKHPLKIALGVNNLFNTTYFDHLSRLRQYGVYGLGVNAFINLSYPINIILN